MDVSLLHALTDRVAALAAPSAMRPDAWPLGERVDAWARGRGLVLGEPDTTPLGRARCERLAARAFPTADLDRVDLFARWLTWTFALDDTVDHAPFAGSATAVHGLYDDLLRGVRCGHARPGARPLESTLVELWQATSAGTSRDWRRRFLAHMEENRDGCAEEAVNRRVGRVPSLKAYAALRRRACGPFMYDLIEPVLGVEVPVRLLATPDWRTVTEGTADIVAWTNDLVSHVCEAARDDAHNMPSVLAAAYGIDPGKAGEWVVERIAIRIGDVAAAARTLPGMLDLLRPTDEQRDAAVQVVRVLLDTPRAHVEWLIESGRYGPEAGLSSPAPGRRPAARLDGLASLR
ncbi:MULTISPECIES: terpene synthase family protein [Thermomonosporaceae]|uniref:terpene synthase family protein n=1 Tax=Thermomonosporaceae TaxID=2012 RepID=UPI00255AA9D7|nr:MULTISPECIES: terpene synthase family protein [Thermomonosporaceae]MDL4771251.1 terpene synthase family protein [Actinomadura xylanilytica]